MRVHEDWQAEFAEADCYEVRGGVIARQGAVLVGVAVAAGATLGTSTYPGALEPVRVTHGGHVLALCYDTGHDSTIVAIAPTTPR